MNTDDVVGLLVGVALINAAYWGVIRPRNIRRERKENQ